MCERRATKFFSMVSDQGGEEHRHISSNSRLGNRWVVRTRRKVRYDLQRFTMTKADGDFVGNSAGCYRSTEQPRQILVCQHVPGKKAS